jgi:hypothetical protein
MDFKLISNICKGYQFGYEQSVVPLVEWSSRWLDIANSVSMLKERFKTYSYNLSVTELMAAKNSLILSLILTNPGFLEKFSKRTGDEVSPFSSKLLCHLHDNPAYWMFFHIEKWLEDSLYEVYDPMVQKTVILSIPHVIPTAINTSITDRQYLALVFDNGICRQTLGYSHSYRTLLWDDLDFFCRGLDEPLYESAGLNGIINAYHAEFLLLDEISNAPLRQNGLFPSCFCWKQFFLLGVQAEGFFGNWITEQRGDFIQMRYMGPDGALLQVDVPNQLLNGKSKKEFWTPFKQAEPILFINIKSNEIALTAKSDGGFALLLELLRFQFPSVKQGLNPDYALTFDILEIARNIEGFTYPWQRWYDVFPEANWNPLNQVTGF